ncbi:PEP-CTERM system histidine kinase PrsK [Thalassotalea nanhaiensis]|uniref:histidine kinase n=1 Tax=Thalassotalea nanhaiensis TaxID=3065648 RepID=A0ABY9TJP7_9GAMM|nr:PEP-CTERM system histidine kinase PrsK [Colwelliaceae bacterium SQ345]
MQIRVNELLLNSVFKIQTNFDFIIIIEYQMELLGLIGYGVATIAYLVFFLLLMVARQKTFASQLVIYACLTTLLSVAVCALQVYQSFSLQITFIFEAIKIAFWSLLFISVNTGLQSFQQFIANRQVKKYLLIWLGLSVFGAISVLFLNKYEWLFIVLLALNLFALVNLEQVFRNHQKQLRWALWPLTIGLGCLFIFDFVMYSQASMVNRLDFDFWYARGFITAAVMPLLLLSSKRLKDCSPDLFISRDVVFYSSIIVFSGLYLLILALSGYLIRYIGGQWSDLLSTVFMVLGLLALVALLIANSLRAKIKVFIGKHFFANKYDYRVEWLKLIAAIENDDSNDLFVSACKAMGECLQVNYCAFLKVHGEDLDVVYQGELNLNAQVLKQLHDVHLYCEKQQWIVDVREYQRYPQRYSSLDIESNVLLKSHIDLIIPTYSQQSLMGYFVLPGPQEKPMLNWEDRDFLFAVSKQLGNYLSLQNAQMKLAQSQQFSVFHRMSAFVLHDLKNIQAQLSLITKNATQHQHNPEFVADVFSTVESASERLNKVVLQLRKKSNEAPKDNKKEIDVGDVIRQSVEICNQDNPQVSCHYDENLLMWIEQERLLNVLIHLIQNAQQASQHDGVVNVSGKINTNGLIITIEDDGHGMSSKFIREQLFKPFSTTKGNAGMGIGVYEAKQFIEEMNGKISVESTIGKGSLFTIKLPLHELSKESE